MTGEAGERIVARCHCGQVAIDLPRRPEEVTVSGAVDPYVRSDLDEACLTNWRCGRCGCATHWTGLGAYAEGKMGVNARMLDEKLLDGLPVKLVDGASW